MGKSVPIYGQASRPYMGNAAPIDGHASVHIWAMTMSIYGRGAVHIWASRQVPPGDKSASIPHYGGSFKSSIFCRRDCPNRVRTGDSLPLWRDGDHRVHRLCNCCVSWGQPQYVDGDHRVHRLCNYCI